MKLTFKLKYFFYFCWLWANFSIGQGTSSKKKNVYTTVPETIKKDGYPVEEHHVVTSDGYILGLHRIPHGKNSRNTSNNVVYLMHGFLMSSALWIIPGENSLAYILADEGYDVWMANARGNKYSRNHTTLNPDTDSKFWNFSWHEIGTIDTPTTIDYILATTGQKQLYHIGHSQGTTSFYVMTSMLPEYNSKIIAHISLSPVAYMKHVISPPFRMVSSMNLRLEALTSLIGQHEIYPHSKFFVWAAKKFCHNENITQVMCSNGLFIIGGYNSKELNHTLLPAIVHHNPAGSSVKQLYHYTQEINSGFFRQYDYRLKNWKHYGRLSPPKYNLSAITVPIYLFYSKNDWLSHEIDVLKLCKKLGKSCTEKILVGNGTYTHFDYLFGIHAPQYVYSKVISIMREKNSSN